MSYPTEKLKSLSFIKTGKLDSNAANANGAYPFFTCDPNTLRINTWAYDTEAVLLAGNNASGNYTAKYYSGKFNAYQRVYIIETADAKRLNIRFLCYAINQQLHLLKKMSSGSTTKFLTLGMLHGLDIPLPAIEIQEGVVNILSSYDDLIENNQKQIKLLEEAAQRLYKEWFVDLRFPGHENVKIVGGVPEGWNQCTLGEMASILRRGISPKYDDDGKYLVISQKCIRRSIMDTGEARRESKEYAPELNLQDADTVICSTGTGTLGRVGQVCGTYPDTTFDSHVTLVRTENYQNFFYQAVKSQQEFLMGMGRGSTNQQELYRNVIESLQILVPTQEILNKAEKMLSSMHHKVTALNSQILLLIEVRDRLLPKLMSGELEV